MSAENPMQEHLDRVVEALNRDDFNRAMAEWLLAFDAAGEDEGSLRALDLVFDEMFDDAHTEKLRDLDRVVAFLEDAAQRIAESFPWSELRLLALSLRVFFLRMQSRAEEALAVVMEQEQVLEETGRQEEARAAHLLHKKAQLLEELGRTDEAQAEYGRALALAKRAAPLPEDAAEGLRHAWVYVLHGELRTELGALHEKTGEDDAAEALYRETLAILEPFLAELPVHSLLDATRRLVALLERQQRLAEALELQRKLLEFAAKFPLGDAVRGNMQYKMASLCWRLGHEEEAQQHADEAHRLLRGIDPGELADDDETLEDLRRMMDDFPRE